MFLCRMYLLYSSEVPWDIYIGNMFSKCRVINGEYIVKISRGIVELVYEVTRMTVTTNSQHTVQMTATARLQSFRNSIVTCPNGETLTVKFNLIIRNIF